MIKLIDILLEHEASSGNNFSLEKNIKNINFDSPEQVEDLSFQIKSRSISKTPGVLSHELITIDIFDLPDGYRDKVSLRPYHLIFGESSLAIFDTFKLDTIAGLSRTNCEKFLADKKAKGEDEYNDAFIGGLTNFAGNQIFQFFNVSRMRHPGMARRLLTHESLHLSRTLISLFENPKINLDEPEWWNKPENTYTDMKDASEEFFAEVLERTSTIAFNRWDKVS